MKDIESKKEKRSLDELLSHDESKKISGKRVKSDNKDSKSGVEKKSNESIFKYFQKKSGDD